MNSRSGGGKFAAGEGEMRVRWKFDQLLHGDVALRLAEPQGSGQGA